MSSWRLLPALAAAVGLLAAAPGQAEVRALVIGIDDYAYVTPLHGAVADARDIEQALQKVGVRDLTLILNRDATRAAIEGAWQELMARIQPGDTVIFTYAGHGSRTEEAVAGSEADGKDEFLVLSGFDLDRPSTGERLLDDMINGWFRDAEGKGATVLAAVDACHSGTAFRRLDPRAPPPTTRFVEIPIDTELLEIPLPPEAKGGLDEKALSELTWLAAAQDDQTVPELPIPRADGSMERRGAMSWAFARAIEGAADADRDGTLTRGELYDFAEAKVREFAAARQTPNFWPLEQRDQPLLPLAGPGSAGSLPVVGPVRLALVGTEQLPAGLENVELVTDRARAELVYDAGRRDVVTALGDVVAEAIAGTGLQAVIDKELTLRRLQLSLAGSQLRTRVLPDDRMHGDGDEITVAIDGIRQPYLTLFNLAGDGTVQFLFPAEGDSPTVPVGSRFVLGPIYVGAPFGADHIVAVVTPGPPEALLAALRAHDLKPAVSTVAKSILAALAEPGAQIGVQGIFTGRR